MVSVLVDIFTALHRSLTVKQALRLSGAFFFLLNQCGSADVTSYWMSRFWRKLFFDDLILLKICTSDCRTNHWEMKKMRGFSIAISTNLTCQLYFYILLVCKAVKCMFLIILVSQRYRIFSSFHACVFAGKGWVSAGWAGGHELEIERQREERSLCAGSPVVRSGGNKGTRWRSSSVSPECCRSPVKPSHPPSILHIDAAQTDTLTARTPLAIHPPATACAMWHRGLTRHRYELLFHVSCSECVSWEVTCWEGSEEFRDKVGAASRRRVRGARLPGQSWRQGEEDQNEGIQHRCTEAAFCFWHKQHTRRNNELLCYCALFYYYDEANGNKFELHVLYTIINICSDNV